MASVVGIVNNALIKIGENTITALSENTKAARIANQIYEQTRDALLRSHPWNFAMSRGECAQLSTTPAFGFAYEFALPSDCLRVLRMEEHDYDFKVEGRKILTDESTCKILYIKQVVDPNQFDAMFVEVLSARMALELSYSLAENNQLTDMMAALYKQKIREARSMDGQESSPDELLATTWTDSRL